MPVSTTGPAARASLILGVVITAVSFIALLVILGLYFADIIPHQSLYWATLWGFPAGFALMCLHLLLSLGRRRQPMS
ncbi:hypothetical protein [Nesterenkonia muleiensis]|uniref:hypothetical protein n=1 Tax=Nesterenkonia muleiensis TaxID=2282648 RepID=UPI000E7399D1|nr:hypothetical protein [Nesterenkonia muleiensis]